MRCTPFLGIITEHFGGAFPLWLAPVQAKIIPVSNTAHLDCAEQVHLQMKKAGIRAELDQRDEKLGYKIREAQMKKIPYIAVVGDREYVNVVFLQSLFFVLPLL